MPSPPDYDSKTKEIELFDTWIVARSKPKRLFQPRFEVITRLWTDRATWGTELEYRTLAAWGFGHAVFDQDGGSVVCALFSSWFPGLSGLDGTRVFDGFVELAVAQRDQLVVVAQHFEELYDTLLAQSYGGNAAFVHCGGDHGDSRIALVACRKGEVLFLARFLLDGHATSFGLEPLVARSTIRTRDFIPALPTHGVFDIPRDTIDKIGIEDSICKPCTACDVFARGEARKHVHLATGELDIVDAFNVVFAFEGFETAVEDGFVKVGPGLDGANPDARAVGGMNHIVHETFVGVKVLQSIENQS